jgi:hypothetical protein
VRHEVNAYIRSGVFDGIIDFDAMLSDGGNPPRLKSEYATWSETDWLHPGPAGYQKMAKTPALSLLGQSRSDSPFVRPSHTPLRPLIASSQHGQEREVRMVASWVLQTC